MGIPDNCTCWWGSYVRHGGGTDFDIARYDPKCPYHFDYYDDPDPEYYGGPDFVPDYDLARDIERGK